jgi:hypothetical protein
MQRKLRLPSPAIVIACIALIAALTGTSYAAINSLAPRNSVANSSIRNNAVTSLKVKDRSLLARDFKLGQLPAGAPGAAGAPGTAGARGPTGPAGPSGSASIRWALVKGDATIVAQSGGITMTSHSPGNYFMDFGSAQNTKLILATSAFAGGDTSARGTTIGGPCGGTTEGMVCSTANDTSHVHVQTFSTADVLADHSYYVAVFG